MDPASVTAILALIDGAFTGYERALALLTRLRAEGLITPEQQQELLDRVARSRARVGLPPSDGLLGTP